MNGIYQHCSEQHLAPISRGVRFPLQQPPGAGIEDTERTDAIRGADGKRLTYRRTSAKSHKAQPPAPLAWPQTAAVAQQLELDLPAVRPLAMSGETSHSYNLSSWRTNRSRID